MAMTRNELISPARKVESLIVHLRGQGVILDNDLARLYGVPTKALVQAVNRNRSRFPPDFMVQLTTVEFAFLRSQFVTSNARGSGGRVTEVSEAGSVPFLKVANDADHPLLLLDGEELLGAKQNRILNTTVLVAVHTEVTIPVSCVEQGRWGYRGRQCRPGDASLFASLRARKAAWVSQSLCAGRGHRADQGGVWAHLADRASELEQAPLE